MPGGGGLWNRPNTIMDASQPTTLLYMCLHNIAIPPNMNVAGPQCPVAGQRGWRRIRVSTTWKPIQFNNFDNDDDIAYLMMWRLFGGAFAEHAVGGPYIFYCLGLRHTYLLPSVLDYGNDIYNNSPIGKSSTTHMAWTSMGCEQTYDGIFLWPNANDWKVRDGRNKQNERDGPKECICLWFGAEGVSGVCF